MKKPGAVWVHVVDDRGIDVDAVDTTVDGNGRPTDGSGTAVFDPLPAGAYIVDLVPLGDDLLDRFERPTTPTTRSVSVAPGQIAYVPYQLARKPSLSVQVVKTASPRTLLGGASVSADGPQPRTETTVGATGTADLGRVSAGAYEIRVTLGDEDARRFATRRDFASTAEKVTLAPGQERLVVVEVEPINVVTPRVVMEERLLTVDHWPGDSEALAGRVDLSLGQTNADHRYAGRSTLRCTSTAEVEAFWDEACTEGARIAGALESGVALPEPKQADLRAGTTVPVYLRGMSGAGTVTISLEAEPPDDRFVRLGEPAPPVDAEIRPLVRPHVNIGWVDGDGVDGVQVQLAGSAASHALPASLASGLAQWVERGIAPGRYDCAFTFPDGVEYLLHDEAGTPVDAASVDLQPGGPAVTYRIRKVKASFAVSCDVGGVAADVALQLKLKTVGAPVTLDSRKGPAPAEVPVTKVGQQCEIESLTSDGADVYEMIEVEST